MTNVSLRGRAYKCNRCENFIGERAKVVSHVYKLHVPLEEAPFYCTLCLFRCQRQKELTKHVRGFVPHLNRQEALEKLGPVDAKLFLKQSTKPYAIQESDMVRLSREESESIWQERSKLVFRNVQNAALPSLPVLPMPQACTTVTEASNNDLLAEAVASTFPTLDDLDSLAGMSPTIHLFEESEIPQPVTEKKLVSLPQSDIQVQSLSSIRVPYKRLSTETDTQHTTKRPRLTEDISPPTSIVAKPPTSIVAKPPTSIVADQTSPHPTSPHSSHVATPQNSPGKSPSSSSSSASSPSSTQSSPLLNRKTSEDFQSELVSLIKREFEYIHARLDRINQRVEENTRILHNLDQNVSQNMAHQYYMACYNASSSHHSHKQENTSHHTHHTADKENHKTHYHYH